MMAKEACHDDNSMDAKAGSFSTSIHGLNMPLMVGFVLLVCGFFWFMVVENSAMHARDREQASRQHEAMIAAVEDQTMVLLAPEDRQQVLYQIYKKKFEARNKVTIP